MRALLCLPVTGSAGEEKNTMHLKQLLAGVTALALGLSLAACGADSSSAAQ